MKYLIALILCFSLNFAFGQISVVYPSNMNVFYYGLNNPINAVVENYSCDSVIISSTDGEIIYDSKCKYYFIPKDKRNALIYIKVISDNDTIDIDCKRFRIKHIPLKARIGGRIYGEISKKVLIAAPYMIVNDNNSLLYARIKSYKTTIISGNDSIFSCVNEGSRFNEKIIEAIKKAKSKDKLIFSEIMVKLPFGEENIEYLELFIE